MGEITIRTLRGFGELRQAVFPVHIAFGDPVTDLHVERARTFIEPHRHHTAWDGDTCVGSAAALSWRVAVPGGSVATAAVTYVGVLPTHRRRGVAYALMEKQLDDAAGRGEPLATLWASESSIYQRFGYGPAAADRQVTVETARSAYVGEPDGGGSVSIRPLDDVRDDIVAAWEQAWTRLPAEHDRDARYWDRLFVDDEARRRGMSALMTMVHHDEDGSADGYVLYRVKSGWVGALPVHEAHVLESVAVDDDVEAALLRCVFDLDLVRTVVLHHRPVDDHLRWRFREPRRLVGESAVDSIWVRILDTADALSARTYERTDTIVIEVTDGFRPDGAAAGRFRLTVTDDGVGECERTDDEADVTVDVVDLGAAYLGQHSLRQLVGRGGIREHVEGAVRRLDLVLRVGEPARCLTDF